jgi:UDP-N-acetylglucosamine--N-acetylmuramyl-(pentapeptide) pyrophosphoryl-undecaprenol N-acetylglucosamine transferase
MEGEIIFRQKIDYRAIPAAGLHGVGLSNLPGNLLQLLRGYRKAGNIIKDFQPDVLFFTGGYLAVPAAFAGRSLPSLVFLPDIEPGFAIKAIMRLAAKVALAVEDSQKYLPRKKEFLVSGYPVRSDLLKWTREEGLRALELSRELPVLLVFGGSRGSRSINRALVKALPMLLEDFQVVHITGWLDWDEMEENREGLSNTQRNRYRVFPFLHENMGAALRAANLVVSRSGASVLGEYPLFGLPAILVPYPHAWRYQKTNASYLAEHGAAEILQDDQLEEQLLYRIQSIFNDPERLDDMRAAMVSLAQPQAAKKIASELINLAGETAGGGVE